MYSYYKANAAKFIEEFLGIKLTWYQKVLLRQNFNLRASRGQDDRDFKFAWNVINCMLNKDSNLVMFDNEHSNDFVYRFKNGSTISIIGNLMANDGDDSNNTVVDELKEER